MSGKIGDAGGPATSARIVAEAGEPTSGLGDGGKTGHLLVQGSVDGEAPVGEGYVNPEFLTPKELSTMVAGFGVQIYVSMRGRDETYSHRQAIEEAASITCLAIEDDAIGSIFEERTKKLGLPKNIMQESRRRLKEALDAAAAVEGEG